MRYLAIYIMLLMSLCVSAQENNKNNGIDTISVTSQLPSGGESVGLPIAMRLAIQNFHELPSIENPLKIDKKAIELRHGNPYLFKLDNGGIYGVGSTRGIYLGTFQGLGITNGKVGVNVGVQRAFNPLTGSWETIPMVSPYVRIAGQAIGFDVGGMVYSILREAALKNEMSGPNYRPDMNGGRGPAIIGPPIDTKPVKFDTVELPHYAKKQMEGK